MDLNSRNRKELVDILKNSGIDSPEVLNAIGKVKRELFVPPELKNYAYNNTSLPISSHQTISQPFTVAFMTQVMEVQPGDKILEIGTGSGYQAAVLSKLGAEVYSVERIEKLHENAKSLLAELGYNVFLKLDDGTLGWKEFAPYDKIIVTAGAPDIPNHLVEQLAGNGKLIVPVGDQQSQRLLVVTNLKEGLAKKYYEYFKFVPLIGEDGWKA